MKRLLTALEEIQPKDDRSGWERADYMREYHRLWDARFFLTQNWSIALANGFILISWIPVLVGLNLLVRSDLLSPPLAMALLVPKVFFDFIWFLPKTLSMIDTWFESRVKLDPDFYSDFLRALITNDDATISNFIPPDREPSLLDMTAVVDAVMAVVERNSNLKA